ncbi:hypothetical protein [Pseudomonas chlororaphis]|uniref:hypothetical protein n=2 Tax=Pseudomonas chlororaphis TaxID=587753 RepID=UPI000F5856B0|nr:hypothetical protein [Pseudomonas chlororaphis]UQS92428.1 hypothetical protein M5C90_15270 [Pseudomonas chlororaphis subsp. piscium]
MDLQEGSAGSAGRAGCWRIQTARPFMTIYIANPQGADMGKRASNFKEDTLKLISKLPTELSLAALLGTLPIYLFSHNSKSLDEMVSGLLAIGPLIDYFGWMLVPYASLLIIKYGVRFSSDRSKNSFNFIHKIIAEAGTGFQTILRTGVGVTIGILILPKAITTPTPAQYAMLYWMIVIVSIFSCAISFLKDEIIQRTERPTYRNPLKLDVKK